MSSAPRRTGAVPTAPAVRARSAPRPLVGLLLAAVAGCTGCAPEPDAADGSGADGTPRVVASIFPVADLLERLAGESARASVLLPAGTSPALFQPTPAEMRRIAGSALYVEVGGGLDTWLRDVARQGARARLVTLTEGMELHGEGHEPGTGNPHVWLDPVRVRDHLVPLLADALVGVAPGGEAEIRARARALTDTLTTLHREVEALLAPHRGATILATHGAWSYFAERYGLRELTPVHPRPGSEPSARALAALVDSARAHGVRAVFAEPQLGATAARALAAELGVPVRVLDPLGGPDVPGRDGYPALIRYNARTVADALAAESPS